MTLRKSFVAILLITVQASLVAASLGLYDPSSPVPLFDSNKELESFSFKTELKRAEESYYSNMTIFLLTGGPGSEVWENFGHAAFLVKPEKGRSIIYDYGLFEFDKSFYLNFALGRLYYLAGTSGADYRIANLVDDDRSVTLTELALTPLEKANLLAFLNYNVQPDNSRYLYDYYFDNCATRLRDIYSAVRNGKLESLTDTPYGETLRSLSIRYLSRSSFIVTYLINYLLGPRADRAITTYQAMFIPEILNNEILKYQNSSSEAIYESTRKATPTYYPFNYYALLLSLSLAIVIILSGSKHALIRILANLLSFTSELILGIASLVLWFFILASMHTITYGNINGVIISPLLLLLAFLHLVPKKYNKKRVSSLLAAILLAITLTLFLCKISLMDYLEQDNYSYYLTAVAIYTAESYPLLKHLFRKRS